MARPLKAHPWRRLRELGGAVYRRTPFGAASSRLAFATVCIEHVAGRRALEIGGPSGIFADDRFIPVYRSIGSLDGCNYQSATLWEGSLHEGRNYNFLAGRGPGHQYLLEATDLDRIPSGEYEAVISSHMLEHSANPLRALREWTRVLADGGVLLLVLPHRDGTFDHRRPVTPLAHMIQDEQKGVGEDDATHVREILELHDLAMDPPAGDLEAFERRCLDNVNSRGMHHHVFDLRTAIQLVDNIGMQILLAATARPYHIVVLAKKSPAPDNLAFLAVDAECLRRSRFRSDRELRTG